MSERDNSSSSDGGSKTNTNSDTNSKKSESRFGQSCLNSESEVKNQKKSATAITPDSKGRKLIARIYRPPSPTLTTCRDIDDEGSPAEDEDEEDDDDDDDDDEAKSGKEEAVPWGSLLKFVANKNCPKIKRRTKHPLAKNEKKFVLTLETLMTGSTPILINATKACTIGRIRHVIKRKIKSKHFGIFLNDKELKPDDSTLESHGIVADTKIRIHIKVQTGIADNDDYISSVLRVTQQMNVLKDMLSTKPGESKKEHKSKPRPKEVIDPEKKAQEDERSRDKMSKLREKFAQRNRKPEEKKEKEKKKSRRDGGIAGEHALPVKTPTYDTPPSAPPIIVVANDQELLEQETKEVKASESTGSITNELFAPPDSAEKLEEIRHEFKTTRCGQCRVKLSLILREMPCRCDKIFCEAHRPPMNHCCIVDLQKLDRAKLEKELPKAISVTQKENEDTDMETPKSSNKKLI